MARNGVWCSDHGQFEFKDAGWEVEEPSTYELGTITTIRPGVWTWLCPVCGRVIGRELYRPPADVPERGAVEPVERLGGTGTPDGGFAGQEHGFLAGIHRT